MRGYFTIRTSILLLGLLAAGAPRCAADGDSSPATALPPVVAFEQQPAPALLPPAAPLPRMAPELALASLLLRGQTQKLELAWYTDETEIAAVLPDTQQKGTYQLVREFSAPDALAYRPVRFTGDSFVKTNLITRLLQSEVDHVEKKQGEDLSLSPANYKFSYKGADQIEGRSVHVFQIKPRRKVAGLFKGRIYVDAVSGTLRRAEGTLVKSPSFFIKKIEFVQDYADFSGFTFPIRMHSAAVTRVVGRAIVDIFHRNYQARAGNPPSGAVPVTAQPIVLERE